MQVRPRRAGQPRRAGWYRRIPVGGHARPLHRSVRADRPHLPGPAGGRGSQGPLRCPVSDKSARSQASDLRGLTQVAEDLAGLLPNKSARRGATAGFCQLTRPAGQCGRSAKDRRNSAGHRPFQSAERSRTGPSLLAKSADGPRYLATGRLACRRTYDPAIVAARIKRADRGAENADQLWFFPIRSTLLTRSDGRLQAKQARRPRAPHPVPAASGARRSVVGQADGSSPAAP